MARRAAVLEAGQDLSARTRADLEGDRLRRKVPRWHSIMAIYTAPARRCFSAGIKEESCAAPLLHSSFWMKTTWWIPSIGLERAFRPGDPLERHRAAHARQFLDTSCGQRAVGGDHGRKNDVPGRGELIRKSWLSFAIGIMTLIARNCMSPKIQFGLRGNNKTIRIKHSQPRPGHPCLQRGSCHRGISRTPGTSHQPA